MVQFDVFAGVESLVETADSLEDRAAIGHGDATGRNEAFRGGIDERVGMVAEPRAAGGGNRPLKRGGAVTSQGLRSSDGVGPA